MTDTPSLATLMMLGRAFQESADFEAVLRDVSGDPLDWLARGIPVATYSARFSQTLAEQVPAQIAATGKRPAEAVAQIIQYAFRYGVEVGHSLAEKKAATP